MWLADSMRVWGIHHPNREYWGEIKLDSRLDKDTITSLIFGNYYEMSTLYDNSDTQYQFMLIFFEHIFPIVKRMVDTTEYNYSPLTDYKIDGSHGIEETNELSHSMSGTDSANDTDNSTTGSSASLENEHHVSAYNQVANDTTLQYKDTSNGNENKTYEDTKTHTGNVSESSSDNRNRNEDKVYQESGMRNHSYQELIVAERKLALYDIEKYIVDEFAKNLLVSVW